MCLSSVYELKDGARTLVQEHVSTITTEGEFVKLTDIMGEETIINGKITEIDLVKNEIIVNV